MNNQRVVLGGFWYLFASYDQCCQGVSSTYNVRVGHNSLFVEDNGYWIIYHAYDADQIGIPKLRIESLGWDAAGWPVLASQAQE